MDGYKFLKNNFLENKYTKNKCYEKIIPKYLNK